MLLTTKESLEEKIVRKLVAGECTAGQLLELLNREANSYSIQAVYLALRSLVHTETAIKRGKVYYLNEEWRLKVASLFEKRSSLHLEEGEVVTYHLSSLVNNDLQWKNIVLPLHEKYLKEPIFFYNYHYIWLYLGASRRKSELDYYALFEKNKTLAFCLIGMDSPQDREVKRLIQNDYVQVAIGKKIFAANDYKTIIGDYIITNSFALSLGEEIENCYRHSANIQDFEQRIQSIGVDKNKVKLVVERNKAKAKKIRKKFSSEFFIPPRMVSEFGLYD